jgi:hypothetical protein
LESPLFVGVPPAGALNRCRTYIPVRPVWGAVTAEIARSTSSDAMPDYVSTGKEVKECFRFTCLFPAEKREDHYTSWTPHYVKDRGLQWCCDNEEDSITDRSFRKRLLITRPGTAVSPETYSASDGSLRETECINQWWRYTQKTTPLCAVYMLGYIFQKGNPRIDTTIKGIDSLFIGGDTRYGLGRMHLVDFSVATTVFDKHVKLDEESPLIQSKVSYGHACESEQDCSEAMIGNKELLAGWDYGNPLSARIAWVPGSSLLIEPPCWAINKDGYWSPYHLKQ